MLYPSTENKHGNIYTNRRDGRLCFDFDIRRENLDLNIDAWMADVEELIRDIVLVLYTDIDIGKLKIVWSSSDSDTKISRHLVIKELYFQDWIPMSRQFYHYFKVNWDAFYTYIDVNNFLDGQILRKNSSFRFVYSHKPDGSRTLIPEDPNTPFEDTLVRPPHTWNSGIEQYVSYERLLVPCTEFMERPRRAPVPLELLLTL